MMLQYFVIGIFYSLIFKEQNVKEHAKIKSKI